MKTPPASSSALSPSTLAELGRQQVAAGRFKEAVESFKQLLKVQPDAPEVRALLGQAYLGRARGLAAKGMTKEARIVLENTADSRGLVVDPGFYLALLIRQGQLRQAADYARKLGQAGSDGGAGVGGLTTVIGLAADPDGSPAGRALTAWCEGAEGDQLERALQALSLRSEAGPLRLLIKAATLADDDGTKRAALLAMVPASSVFAPLGRALALALDDNPGALLADWAELSPAQRRLVLELRGVTPAAAALLAELDQAEGSGPEAVLSLLLGKSGRSLKPAAARAACLELLPWAPGRLGQVEAAFGRLSEAERLRVAALSAELRQEWSDAVDAWGETAAALVAENTAEARLTAALVYRHLAQLEQRYPLHDRRAQILAAEINWLERSLECDPEDLESVLALLRRLDEAEQVEPRSTWIDWALARFPEQAPILEAALEDAARRNAFKKAAGFARRLLAVDPINQRARQRLIELHLAQARKQMRAGRADLAAKELAAAGEWDRPDRRQPALALSRALVARRLTPGPEAEAALRDAVQLAGGGIAGGLHALIEAQLQGASEAELKPLRTPLNGLLRARPEQGALLALVALLARPELRAHKRAAAEALGLVSAWLGRGAALDWSVDQLQLICEALHTLGAYPLMERFARQAQRRDHRQLIYRYYAILARAQGDGRKIGLQDLYLLQTLHDDARQAQDFPLMNRVEVLLNQANPFAGIDPEVDDEDLEDEDFLGGESGLEMLRQVLAEAGEAETDVVVLAERLGIDATVRKVVQAFKRLAKSHGPLPVPLNLLESALEPLIQFELEKRRSQGEAPAPAARRKKGGFW